MELAERKIYRVLDKLSMILLCIYMADACVFGGGRMIEIGPIGFRMALLFALLVLSIPQLIVNFKSIIKNRFIIMLLIFGVWLIFSTIIGIVNNNNFNILISDIKGYCYFSLALVTLVNIRTKERIETLMKVMLYATFVFALLHIAYMIVYLTSETLYNELLILGVKKYFSLIGYVTNKIARVFFTSAMYLLCGFVFSMYFFTKESEKPFKNRVKYLVIAGFSIFAMMVTYTRSVYLGAGVTVFCTVLVYLINVTKEVRKKAMAFIISSVAIFGIITLGFNLTQKTDYFTFAITRTLITFSGSEENEVEEKPDGDVSDEEPDEDSSEEDQDETKEDDVENQEEELIKQYLGITISSDKIREATKNELAAKIKDSPFIGNGLGMGLDVRDNGTGFNEYFYLDLVAKMGIIGLLIYLLPVIYMTICIFTKRIRNEKLAQIWLFILWGFMAYSYFNPYMNASLGISMYCCVFAIMNTFLKKDKTL